MKELHIILRTAPATRTSRNRARFAPTSVPASTLAGLAVPPMDQLRIDIDEVDSRRRARVADRAGALLVCPAVPMQLIAPVPSPANDTPPPGPSPSVAWGISAVKADLSPCSGKGVTVAVLDTGLDRKHPAFRGGKLEILEKDFTGAGHGDTNGHGTHCAGTILGRDVKGTRIGVARQASTLLVGKVLGPGGGSSDQIVQAMNWAVDQEADVISMSLGIDFPGLVARYTNAGYPSSMAASKALEGFRLNLKLFETVAAAIQARAAFGRIALVIAATGNESQRQSRPDLTVAASVPAVAAGILSVGALGPGPTGLVVAPFSNTQPSVSAPGVDVLSAKTGGGLVSLSGTSMATPHVAGVAALWIESLRNAGTLDLSTLTTRLLGSATLTGLAKGAQPADVGLGMVTAPL